MKYDYREFGNDLFELEFPDDLSEGERFTLTNNVIGIDVYDNHLRVLMNNNQEDDNNKYFYYSYGPYDGIVRSEVNMVKMDDMGVDLFCTHKNPVFLTIFNRDGKEIKRTAFNTTTISEVYENDEHIMIDIEFTNSEELI